MNVTAAAETGAARTGPGHSISSLEALFICIGLFGFVSNCVSAAIFRQLKPFILKTSRVLLIHQSCVDSVASLFLLGRMASPRMPYFTDLPSNVWSHMLCRLWASNNLFWSMAVLSVYSLIALSLDHYIAVLYPSFFFSINKSAESTAKRKIYLLLLILSAWLASITYLCSTVGNYGVANGKCVGFVTNVTTVFTYYNISLKLFFPLITFSYLYLRMLSRYRKHVSTVVAGTGAPITATENKSQQQIKKALFLLCCLRTVLYIICFAPNQFLFFLSAAEVTRNMIGTLAHTLTVALLNLYACIDPIINFITLKPFRRKLKHMCYHVSARLGVTSTVETNETDPTPH